MELESITKEEMARLNLPIIQGGMGAGVSNWRLARAVSMTGQLGVVSGTGSPDILLRRLQRGDKEMVSAIERLNVPNEEFAKELIGDYFVKGGIPPGQDFRQHTKPSLYMSPDRVLTLRPRVNGLSFLEELAILSVFVEVSLAKEGHDNPVGVNFLQKIEWPLLPSVYGAMLAGVDALLVGAGFPREIPGIVTNFMNNEPSSISISVADNKGGTGMYQLQFTPPSKYAAPSKRPAFGAIVATEIGVKAVSKADFFVIESTKGGGHTVPPRNPVVDASGDLLFGPDDDLNLERLYGILERRGDKAQPFWLAGAYASRLKEAQEKGAVGVQVGTAFAYCHESGMDPQRRRENIDAIMNGANVITMERLSSTGFPFKALVVGDSIVNPDVLEARTRVCNVSYLLSAYEKPNRRGVDFRCPAEPVEIYLRKGGRIEDTIGRGCLCDALMKKIGLGSPGEPTVDTIGKDVTPVIELVQRFGEYHAKDVVDFILNS
ncbi:MAG: nitronate monooxygenase [Candidatus Woesearchaeota archaeon]